MSHFNVDNEGSGFAVSGDWDALLNEANAHVEAVGEENTAAYFEGVETEEQVDDPRRAPEAPAFTAPPEPPAFTTHQEEPVEAPSLQETSSEASHEDQEEDDLLAPPAFDPNAFQEPEEASHEEEKGEDLAPAVEDPRLVAPVDPFAPPAFVDAPVEEPRREEEEKPQVEAAPVVEVSERPVVQAPRIRVPSLADDLAKVRQVIAILDAYRALSHEEMVVAAQFITGGEEVTDEGEFIVKVLNVDPMLSVTMKALQEAKGLDDVERSFFIIELSDEVLYSLGSLVSVFTDEEPKRSEGRGKYARTLVRNIEKLDSKAMNFVTSTESVLAAAERK